MRKFIKVLLVICGLIAVIPLISCKKKVVYSVGDIILTDGRKINVNKVPNFKVAENNKPVAVVAFIDKAGNPYGISLKQTEKHIQWALHKGYSENFSTLTCKCVETDTGYNITGATEGYKSWNEIIKTEKEDSSNPKLNYPSFDWVLNYAKKEKLDNGNETGWFLPSIYELYEVYKNKNILTPSLSKATRTDWKWNNEYWSSSQYEQNKYCAWYVGFDDGYVGNYYKYLYGDVIAIKKF
jgi:hypothetical protein